MDEFTFSTTVAIGSLIGGLIAVPDAAATTIVVFVIGNALFSLLAYSVLGAVVTFLRGDVRT